MTMRWTARLLASGAAVAVLVTGCAGSGGDAPTAGDDTIVVALSTEPSTLDAQAVNDRASRAITFNIFETLLFRAADGSIAPRLATAYKNIDDETWEVDLRSGVTFHNGEAFDAETAVASINRIIDPDYETQRTSYTEGITGAEVVDADTLRIHTDGVNAVLPAQLTSIPMVPKDADAIDIGQKPVGTGAYEFVSWDKGRDIRLRVYDGYWGTKPSIQNVVARVIPDSQTALSALRAGEVDIVPDLMPEDAESAPQAQSVPGIDFSYVAFNTYKEELSDPRVRQAMNYAIDKEQLAETIYGGYAEPDDAQNLTESMIGYNPDLGPFPYDPAKAKSLLAEAGYPNGFEVTLNVPIGRYSKGEESADFIAEQLGAVGIKTTVRRWEWNEYRDAGRIAGDEANAFDLKYGWNSNEWFDAGRIIAHITCDGTSSKICDPEIDRLWEQAGATVDTDTRAELYQQGWAQLTKNPYAIYLLRQDYLYGLSAAVKWSPLRQDDELDFSTMSLAS